MQHNKKINWMALDLSCAELGISSTGSMIMHGWSPITRLDPKECTKPPLTNWLIDMTNWRTKQTATLWQVLKNYLIGFVRFIFLHFIDMTRRICLLQRHKKITQPFILSKIQYHPKIIGYFCVLLVFLLV